MRSILVGLMLICGLALGQDVAMPSQESGHYVNLDQTVVLWYRAPSAKVVLVRGSFAEGTLSMVKGEDGVFSATVGPLRPGVYTFTYIVDGLRVLSLGGEFDKVTQTSWGRFEVKAVHAPPAVRP